MQLMELVEYVPKFPLIPKKNLFKFNITKYAHHAWKIVVPEINRAYIQKVWWDLEKTPKNFTQINHIKLTLKIKMMILQEYQIL